MNTLKAILRPGVLRAVARAATLTWKWRAPGSLVVLAYHRVLPADSPALGVEQPTMYVSPQTLDLHLSEAKRHFELVHLEDWLRRARDGAALPRLACAITFDDGWRDNFEFALPVLSRHQAPATVFLVSTYIDSERRFWPNRLMSLLRKSFAEPDSVRFPKPVLPLIESTIAAARQRGELVISDLDRIVEKAKAFPEAEIRELIVAAEKGCGPGPEAREILSSEEIARMSATGLVRFGSHTATHYRFDGDGSSEDLEREIVGSRCDLQEICGQPVEVFCYPNGETSPRAIDLVRRHYMGAVTTCKGWHSARADPYLIRRIGLHDDMSNSSESFLSRVSAWL